jgi:hypothetical protein
LGRSDDAITQDAAWMLFDQALLMEGVPLREPAAFVQRLNPRAESFDLDVWRLRVRATATPSARSRYFSLVSEQTQVGSSQAGL